MRRIDRTLRLAALALLPLAAGCLDDERALLLAEPEVGGVLFANYVSLGDAITAGLQSAGINDSTQRQAYPVLLAGMAGARFAIPSIREPGCPPPLVGPAPLTDETVGGPGAPRCSFRTLPPPGEINNIAVPSARVLDAVDLLNPNPAPEFLFFSTLILGGRSQLEALRESEPTLVSAFLGNNDALLGALAGDPARITPLPAFEAGLDSVAGAIAASTALDAVLIGVVPPEFTPLLQPGAYYWAIAQVGGLPKPVSDDCRPYTILGEPRPMAFGNKVSFLAVASPLVPEISCADDAPFVLNAQEQAEVRQRVSAFNAAVAARAQANGWIFVDPAEPFAGLVGQPAFVRGCQALRTPPPPPLFQTAVAISCPVPGVTSRFNFFGSLLSFDGLHPSSLFHRILANALAERINDVHGLELEPLPLGG